jgi:hypothetical protein
MLALIVPSVSEAPRRVASAAAAGPRVTSLVIGRSADLDELDVIGADERRVAI